MSNPFKRALDALRVGCPFCWEWIPTPRSTTKVYSPDGVLGGTCTCGAVFVVDETGKAGGTAVLDVQTLLCDGDVQAGLHLQTDVDVEIKTRPYRGSINTVGMRSPGGGYLTPKVWFARRKAPASDDPESK